MTASVAVVTIARGRHEHLAGQVAGLRRQTRSAEHYVVVSMGDPALADVVAAHAPAEWDVHHAGLPVRDGRLPLAAARNLGAATAIDAGAEHLVFLDVDCVPDRTLVERYAAVLTAQPGSGGPVVLCGGVAYESAPGPGPRRLRHHPARPALAPDRVEVVDDVTLFWSLSFAVSARDLTSLGGFDEAYVGYGAEDTDVGQRLRRAGGRLLFVGGAGAVHQYHPTQDPPVQHVADIVTNANTFADRWGWWPMQDWLERFRELGLADRGLDGRWVTTGRRVDPPVG
ncbi:glycosyltransferase family 2 protein [Oryzobacter telluris]|uniref:glycosyltransferase family 2 protein n=1 Tax=Oryzobacter telluris TaxID=3149179 RepID=UPI00370DD438